MNQDPSIASAMRRHAGQPPAVCVSHEAADPRAAVLLITCNYPALSETFINREIAALMARSHQILVVNCFALDGSLPPCAGPVAIRWEERTHWRDMAHVARKLVRCPRATLRTAWAALRLAGCAEGSRVWRGWLVFLRILARGGENVPTVYAHYLSTPAIAAHLLTEWGGTTFVASGHAADVFGASPRYLRRVCSRARVVVTCTEAGRRHLEGAGISGVLLVRHGVTVHEPSAPRAHPHARLRLVTVARLVEKKGHRELLEVARRLAALRCDFEWRFVGDGELAGVLRAEAARAGVAGRVRWLGACGHSATLAEIGEGDLFVYHSLITASGDRDGVPNVLLEALAAGTRVLCSTFPGAEELRRLLPVTPLLEVSPFDAGRWAVRLAHAVCEPLPSAAERHAAREAVRRRFDGGKAVELVERALGVVHVSPKTESHF